MYKVILMSLVHSLTRSTKVCIVKAMVFPVVMYGCELGHKKGWVFNNWYFGAGEDTLESPGLQRDETNKS